MADTESLEPNPQQHSAGTTQNKKATSTTARQDTPQEKSPNVWTLLALVSPWFFLVLIAVFVYRKVPSDFDVTILIEIAGIALGWVLGFLASPVSKAEETAFSSIAKGISVFLSGYVVSKLDWIFDKESVTRLASNEIGTIRVIVFSASIFLAFLNAYNMRLYVQFEKRQA
jgi:hypothetical protein